MRTQLPIKGERREARKRNRRKMKVSGKSVFVIQAADLKRAREMAK